ncbi:UDP-glycosyltransferase 75C1-like [Carya illinoinensis]|uniref:Glycosyltransferase n=1 Tax=Carya illinoinensis TaxID=32201 RepID=A0A8T1RDJ6_CARIL|nr:UDP-glycosyltransferase 75C1-like [Carya illinoinensis]KAG6664021.1 hypothetical protein CIPAW_02G062700 [Carya illinoinensis]
MNNHHHHFLLICCPAQGHLNPTLQLAKRLIDAGAAVTFATTVHGLRQLKTFPSLEGLSYASFSDGFDDGIKPTNDSSHIISEIKRVGSQTLTDLIQRLSDEHRGVTCLIYTVLLQWAAEVARQVGIPSAFFCIPSTAALAIIHHYFNSQDGVFESFGSEPPNSVQLQGLPPFASTELPSFLLPTSPHASIIPSFKEHIRTLEKDPNPCVILNTFAALEGDAIKAVASMNPIALGPLIPSVLFNGKGDQSDASSFQCQLFESSTKDYLNWLNSKQDHSVAYVSFGSMVTMQRKQTEEILHGLIDSGRPFLLVIRSSEPTMEGQESVDHDVVMKRLKEEGQGLVVPWCSQADVLCHHSVGCFVTHCGWNSTLESIGAGVPMVACPHFSDQVTNAKLVEEVWGIGVKAGVDEEGVVRREELKRCLEMVMGGGEKGEEIMRNVKKWKSLALQAVEEGGSSHNDFKLFMEKFR